MQADNLVLVTGATGFLGSWVCRQLIEHGYKVRALHRKSSSLKLIDDLDVELTEGNITDTESMRRAIQGVNYIVHTASISEYWRDPSNIMKVNVASTSQLLAIAEDNHVKRVVYTSSGSSLGLPLQKKERKSFLINETHVWNMNPKHLLYGYSKHMAEREIQQYVARGNDAVIVNPSIIFGPGDINKISGEIIYYMKKWNVPFIIPGGKNVIHVKDVADGHIAALERGKNGERYLLGNENITQEELLNIMADVMGKNPPTIKLSAKLLQFFAPIFDVIGKAVPLPFSGDHLRLAGKDMYYDTRKATNELGFTAQIPVRIAIEETYQWYLDNGIL